MCGDSHVPGILRWNEGGTHRIAVKSGTIQASGYAKRYFSLTADKVFPVLQFFPDRHLAIAYRSVEEWLAATRRFEILEKLASQVGAGKPAHSAKSAEHGSGARRSMPLRGLTKSGRSHPLRMDGLSRCCRMSC
jgi:hypothetical protein